MSPLDPKELFIRCPYCDASAGCRVLWTLGNSARGVLKLVVVLSAGAFGVSVGSPGYTKLEEMTQLLAFKRKCSHCGGKFFAKSIPPKDPLCGNCDYNLTGNVSGICPECGWKLTRNVKRRVWLKMRLEQRQARREAKKQPPTDS